MKVLIHVCCAPCLTYPHQYLVNHGHEAEALWYNPNIQPFQEYRRRMHEVQRYSALEPIEVDYIDEYEPKCWLKDAITRMDCGESRCEGCFEQRLGKTAEYASKHDFNAFTSTLLVSKHQPHDILRSIGEKAGKEHGVEFIYEDFRKGWKESIKISKAFDLYRQPYCGCIFSEHERYSSEK